MAANAGPLLRSTQATATHAATLTIGQVISLRDALTAERDQQRQSGCAACTVNAYNTRIAALNRVIRKKERQP